MNKMQTSLPMWNALKRPAKILAALAVAGALGSVAQAQITYTPVLTNLWVAVPGTYPDLNAGNNDNLVRGNAIDPVTTNVLFASRGAGSNHIAVVAFANGSNYLGAYNATGVGGAGTLALDQVRVADDGTIYACDLSGGTGSTFRIYKWASDSDFITAPLTVCSIAAPAYRIGDFMDLRGSGANTEIIVCGSTTSGAAICTNVVILRPTDASCTTFTNVSFTLPYSSASFTIAGNGIAFEGTNSAFWVRQGASQSTRRVSYDPATFTSTVTRSNNVDQSVCCGLKYYKANGVELLATVQPNSTQGTVQYARVFQIPAGIFSPLISVLNDAMPANATSKNGNTLGAAS